MATFISKKRYFRRLNHRSLNRPNKSWEWSDSEPNQSMFQPKSAYKEVNPGSLVWCINTKIVTKTAH